MFQDITSLFNGKKQCSKRQERAKRAEILREGPAGLRLDPRRIPSQSCSLVPPALGRREPPASSFTSALSVTASAESAHADRAGCYVQVASMRHQQIKISIDDLNRRFV